MKGHLRTAEALASLLDTKFTFFGITFGLDPLLDLVPWLGDVVGLILSSYLIWIGFTMRIPREELMRMVIHVIIDFLIGLVPFLGFVGDIFYKANIRNIKILKKYDEKKIIEGEIVG